MFLLPLAVLANLLVADLTHHWKTIPVCEADGITVRLRVLDRASLATPDWLAIEVDNHGDSPQKVELVTYRFDAKVEVLATGKALYSGSLASDQRSDSAGKLFTNGRFRDMRYVSDYSAALLGLPGLGPFRVPREDYRVRARFHISIDYDGGQLGTPPDGVPFDFEWQMPTEAGFAAMRVRLRDLLANPVNTASHAYIIGTLLDIPEATRGLTACDLLAALDRRTGSFDGRHSVVARLMTAHTGDPALVRYYKKRLDVGDRAVLDDLACFNIWDTGFAEPVFVIFARNTNETYATRILGRRWNGKFVPRLAKLVIADPIYNRGALALLARHRRDWRGDDKLVQSLSDAVRKAYPAVDKDSRDIPDAELKSWAEAVQFWALTGDPRVVRRLTPALADRRRFRDPRPWFPLDNFGPTVVCEPELVCDAAMDAIWVALDGPDTALRRLGIFLPYGTTMPPNDYVRAWRDLQILTLSARLVAQIIAPLW